MPFTLDEDTVAGRIIAATAEARGEARGLARGEAQGEARERVQTCTALLTRTFGDDPRIPILAHHLASRPVRLPWRTRPARPAASAAVQPITCHPGSDTDGPRRCTAALRRLRRCEATSRPLR